MAATETIYILDDDPDNLDIIDATLDGKGYETKLFTEAEACLKASELDTPDLIITDVNMPVMNGFEFCKSITSNKKLKQTPVIFVSAMDTIEDMMKGYEVGGADYFTRPYRPELLMTKIKKNLADRKNIIKLNEKVKITKATAFEAMNDTERLGLILQFIEDSTQLTEFDAVADRVFEILNSLGLKASLMIHTKNTQLYYSDDHTSKPLEEQLLAKFSHNLPEYSERIGRFYPFKGRLVASHDNVSLLIRNYHDTEHKKLLDFLGGLLNSIEMKTFYLDSSIHELENRKQAASTLIGHANENLNSLKNKFKEHESSILKIIDELIVEMNFEFATLDLHEEQEKIFSNMVESAMSRLLEIYKSGVELDLSFEEVIKELTEFLQQNI